MDFLYHPVGDRWSEEVWVSRGFARVGSPGGDTPRAILKSRPLCSPVFTQERLKVDHLTAV